MLVGFAAAFPCILGFHSYHDFHLLRRLKILKSPTYVAMRPCSVIMLGCHGGIPYDLHIHIGYAIEIRQCPMHTLRSTFVHRTTRCGERHHDRHARAVDLHATASMNSASKPVRTNASGSFTESAFVPRVGAPAFNPVRGRGVTISRRIEDPRSVLSAANMGNEASIVLLLGFASESAFFKMCVEVNRTTIRMRAQFCGIGEGRECFKNFDH
jgi:hypothetical protein